MKKIICLLSVLTLFLSSSVSVWAFGCRSGRFVRSSCNQVFVPARKSHVVAVKEVIAPVAVAVPVIVPAFQFQYIPPAHCAPVGAPNYYQAPNYNQQQPIPPVSSNQQDDQIRALARAIIEEMRKQEGFTDAPPLAHSGQPVQPQVNYLTALSTACAKCHTGQTAKGGVMIFSAPGVLNPLAPKAKIFDAVINGRMPPPTATYRPNAAEIEAIQQWAAQNF